MFQISRKMWLLYFSLLTCLAFAFQNCAKSSFVTGEMDLESAAAVVTNPCTEDQVADLQGNCINNNAISTACTLNGQLVASGTSIQAYETATVPAGSKCLPQTRECTNGTLSGSFTLLSCQPLTSSPTNPITTGTMPPRACFINNVRVESGHFITAYQASA
ncbi:MAG: hypothetical protein ACXWC9_09150, partial [Pseudobdellovibrionaceae bacterium]